MTVPDLHSEFLRTAVAILQEDGRIVGVAIGGSWIARRVDQHSDLDPVEAGLVRFLGDVARVVHAR